MLGDELAELLSMHPALVPAAFHRPSWIYDERVDGWRFIVCEDLEHIRLPGPHGVDHTSRARSTEACQLCGVSVPQSVDRLELNNVLYHTSCWNDNRAKNEPHHEDLRRCAQCGEAIVAGAGRFNLIVRQYHPKCYDAGRHLYSPKRPAAG